MKVEIKTFEDLIEFIENNDLTPQQIDKLVTASIGGIIAGDYTKTETVEILKEHWEKYGKSKGERPIFIDKEDYN